MVATTSMATRSSLELMLDKLQQREDQPKDAPPALPVRPVSRARLPRARRPLQLDSQRRIFDENDAGFKSTGFESKRTKKEDVAERDGIAASAAQQFDHFRKTIESSENSQEMAEKWISKIQKCYRGHQVRCYYEELRRGIMALQSFIRGENARRGYHYRSRSLRAIILIQKQTRKYFERKLLEDHQSATQLQSDIRHYLGRRCSNEIEHEPNSRKNKRGVSRNHGLLADPKDQIVVPRRVLVNLQKRVLRTEAKVREKDGQNLALKRQLQEMEKKWQQYEERMKSMEKEWQDQFTYIQECLAAVNNNRNQNCDIITITAGTPNGGTIDIPMNSVYRQVDQRALGQCDDSNLSEVGHEPACLKFHPHDELRKLRHRFKAWKKDYKNKLRDAQSTAKKLGNSETAKNQKNWWGRLSH